MTSMTQSRGTYLDDTAFQYKLTCLLLAGFYAWFLAGLQVDAYIDRANYLDYARYSAVILARYTDGGPQTILANEPLWLLLNIALEGNLRPDEIVRLIIFFSSFGVAYLTLRSHPSHFLALVMFLLLPQVLKNNIIHLRQGLGITIFLIGWYSRYLPLRLLFIGLAPFVHASFFFIDALFLLNVAYMNLRISTLWRVVGTIIIGLTLGALGIFLAGALGARQGNNYESLSSNGSGLAFLFWLALTIILCLEGKRFVRTNFFEVSLLIFYLATYFLLPVTARIFESSMIVVLIMALGLTSWRHYTFYLMFAFYFFKQWYPLLDQPGFGWALAAYQ